ncbi:hypothetical protein ACMFLR_22400 [Delftia tsuruhatensis]|uniref:hypothetical protein n=1 Tax=Delftia TaxID=80865 RepID=UPI000646F7EC|nr:hypothetical protein [Delftia sp. ZNC0008]
MTTIARYNALRRELLQVELDLAASKRAYLEDGTTGPRGARAALEERRAALRLEIHDVRALVDEARDAAHQAKRHQFLLALIAKCEQHGRHDLVRAASAESLQWLEQQGLMGAYTARA